MATTTNFGWTTPDDTSLVKDGASAIRTLGSAIDTAFVDFKGGTTGQVLKKSSATDLDVEWGAASSGLTLINTTSFSAVASQSINDVFSATYTKYRVIINFSNTAANSFKLRMRVAGADMTTSDYNFQNVELNNTSVSAGRTTSDTSFALSSVGTTGINMYDLLIGQPQQTTNTTLIGHILQTQNTIMSSFNVGITSVTTSFTGFSFFPGSGNMTGDVSVYGFAK